MGSNCSSNSVEFKKVNLIKLDAAKSIVKNPKHACFFTKEQRSVEGGTITDSGNITAIDTTSTACSLYASVDAVTGCGEFDAFELAMYGQMTYGGSFVDYTGTVKQGSNEQSGTSFFNGGAYAPISSLKEYESSISAKMKEDVIRRLARALKEAGIDVDPNDDLDKIVKDMKRNIPNPSRGKTFSSDAASHEKICKAVAEVLNNQFTPGAQRNSEKLIDPSVGPVETCRKVGEWIHSFSIGVNTEFLAVYASVQNAMRNILILDAIMEKLYNNIETKIAEHPDIGLSADTKLYRELYDRAVVESTRQKELLKNILNISLPPAMKEIELALRDETVELSVIKRLNLKPGNTNFADSLAYTISAVGTAALIAQKVHDALKKVGISVNEYLNSPSFQEFNDTIKHKYKNVKADTLADFIKAANVLLSNFKDRDNTELRKALKQVSGSFEFIPDLNYISVTGGDDENEVEGGNRNMSMGQLTDLLYGIDKQERKSEMDIQIERAKKDKLIIIRDFIRRMMDNYADFAKTVGKLAKLFGDEIPISYHSDLLRDNIVKLKNTEVKQVELALIGYYSDITAREVKDAYINNLKMIGTLVENIIDHGASKTGIAVLKEFKNVIIEITTTIDIYSDAINKKLKSGAVESMKGNSEQHGGSEVEGGRRHHRYGASDTDCNTANVSDVTDVQGAGRRHYRHHGASDGSPEIEVEGGRRHRHHGASDADGSIEVEGGRRHRKYGASDVSCTSASTSDVVDVDVTGSCGCGVLGSRINGSSNAMEEIEDNIYGSSCPCLGGTEYFVDGMATATVKGSEDTLGGLDITMRNVQLDQDVIQPELAKSQYSLVKGINDFVYFYYSARIRHSLQEAAKQTAEASEVNYMEVLGDSVANAISKLYRDKDDLLKNITKEMIEEARKELERGNPAKGGNSFHVNDNGIYSEVVTPANLAEVYGQYNEYCPFNIADKIVNVDNNWSDKFNIKPITVNDISNDANIKTAYSGYFNRINKFLPVDIINKLAVVFYLYEQCLQNGAALTPEYNNYINSVAANGLNIRINNPSLTAFDYDLVNNRRDAFHKINILYVEAMDILRYKIDDAFATTVRIKPDTIMVSKLGRGEDTNSVHKGSGYHGGADIDKLVYLVTLTGFNDDDSIAQLNAIRSFIEKDFDVKINLYKVVQAIDIYLKEFTINIAKNPKAVSNIAKILDGTQVIANWFNEDTGDTLWKAFECMGSTSDPTYNGINPYAPSNQFSIAHNYTQDVAGAKKIGPIHYMEQGDNNGTKSEHYYDAVFKSINNVQDENDKQLSISNPFIGVPTAFKKGSSDIQRARDSRRYISDTLDNFQALKNLVNAFVRIGDEFGGTELRRKIFMSPNQMYKYLLDYMKHSAFYTNYGSSTSEFKPSTGKNVMVPEYYMSFSNATGSDFNNFVEENKYFQMIIKAMSAKILVVLGVYDIFEHVQKVDVADPVRMVLGGDDKQKNVTAIPEAAELYFRLPRLVEFYRKLLYWRGDTDEKKITMLPEIGGVFSGIIRIIFQKMYTPEYGNYSDYDVKNVISEINYIYNFYKRSEKSDEPLCHHVIHEFIKEINRKIGVIKGEEMRKYWQLQRKMQSVDAFGSIPSDSSPETNYSILPDENDYSENTGIAPSDKYFYRMKAGNQKEPIITKEIERDSNIKMLKDFRSNIEELLNSVTPIATSVPGLSYTSMIKEAEREMKKHTSADNRLTVAMRLIQTTKELNIENDKAFMFHETVITGLTALGSIYNMIINFRDMMRRLDPVEIELSIIKYLRNNSIPPGQTFATAANVTELVTMQKMMFIVNNTNSISERLRYTIGKNSYLGINLYTLAGIDGFRTNNGVALAGNDYSDDKILEDLKNNTIVNSNSDSPEKQLYIRLRCLARYMTKYDVLMSTYINNLFCFVNSELISLRIINESKSPIQLDFNTLVSTVEELISDVKFYINKFRPFMSKDIIDRFEKKSNPGSINWFEEMFIDNLFKGKGAGENQEYETGTLSEISTLANNVFVHLIRNTGVSLYNVDLNPVLAPAAPGAIPVPAVNQIIANVFRTNSDDFQRSKYEAFGNVLSEMIYYDNTGFNLDSLTFSNYVNAANAILPDVEPLPDTPTVTGLPRLLCGARAINDNVANIPWLSAAGQPWSNGGPFSYRYKFWANNDITEYKSLLFSFNQLLALYLRSCSDNITNKIFGDLITPFANGIASSSVFSPHGNTFPDMSVGANPELVGRRGDPLPGKIICTSLAYIMQRMISDINPRNQTYDYMINGLTDVPVYMKDKYKNGLCYISKLLRALVNKCDIIKDIIQKTKIDLYRSNQYARNVPGGQIIAIPTYVPGVPTTVVNSINPLIGDMTSLSTLQDALPSNQVKEILSELIASISEHTFALLSAAENVQREFSTDIIYFETYNNFVANYKNRYNKNPLMPLSYSLFFVRNIDFKQEEGRQCGYHQDTLFSPDKLIGTTEFKLQYGMRQIVLNNNINMIYYPSIGEQIKKYNESSITSNMIDMEHYERFMQRVISIVRYNIECRNFKSYVTSDLCSTELVSLVSSMITRSRSYSPRPESQVYSYATDRRPASLIFSIESSNQEDEIIKIVSSFNKMDNREEITRMTECINNLIDINILPINLNVLMKDIPLLNLYNYEYTFELMAAKLYNKKPSTFRDKTDVINNVHDTQDAFLALLYHPYLKLEPVNMWLGFNNVLSESYEYISRIMRGDNSLGLSRPKFLSDQLFNKALFRSVYPSASTYDEGGVNSAVGTWRGQYHYDAMAVGNQGDDAARGDRITDRTWLTYPHINPSDSSFSIRHREFNPTHLKILENIGRLRFDTTIVRNLFFIVNVLRITRLKLNRELTSSRNVIVNSHYAVNPSVTEYGLDPFSSNEIYRSKMSDGQSRYDILD